VLPSDDPRALDVSLWAAPLSQRLIRVISKGVGWDQVDARTLEEIVAELFDNFGYEVELTKRTRDGGRDIIAIRHSTARRWCGRAELGPHPCFDERFHS
jgi:hypothetical protein